MKDKIKIVVATHKKYEMPKDEMYLPLHVGAAGKKGDDGTPVDFGYVRDDTGDNISEKNFCFGSQTGLYWAWKHIDAEYLGLVHYRRYFIGRKANKNNKLEAALTFEQLEPMLDKYKVFVPKRRNYYIETIYSQYAHTMNGGAEQFDLAEKIIDELTPEYNHAFKSVMNRTWAHMFNMMIMKKDLINDYCSWLFKILFEMDKRLDLNSMSDFDKRFAGRVSERLFNVWLEYQIEKDVIKRDEIKELPYFEEVNWKTKISSFAAAKLFHKKYGASF